MSVIPRTTLVSTLDRTTRSHEEDGADSDRRVGDVEGRPVVAGDMPLDEIDDGTEAHAAETEYRHLLSRFPVFPVDHVLSR